MTETDEIETLPTVGEQLRAAREEQGLTLEELAEQTRIPRRHLESLETSDWSRLASVQMAHGSASVRL